MIPSKGCDGPCQWEWSLQGDQEAEKALPLLLASSQLEPTEKINYNMVVAYGRKECSQVATS